jgi:epidermal growth factor receptor substrate 15
MNMTNALTQEWWVTEEQKAKYAGYFRRYDEDCDGFITGLQVKELFTRSGLPKDVLAKILCVHY